MLPNAEKLEVYECGEPTIGSSFVQFDLRFYVVALLFIIFDVEVAFFFPWATVFGKATHLIGPELPVVDGRLDPGGEPTAVAAAIARFASWASRDPTVPTLCRRSCGRARRGGRSGGATRRRCIRRPGTTGADFVCRHRACFSPC